METLLINVIIGFWLVLFAGMAVLPFILESSSARRTPIEAKEDQIISIQPVAMPGTERRPLTTIPVAAPERDHREAA